MNTTTVPPRDLELLGARVAITTALLGALSLLAALGVVVLDRADESPAMRTAETVIETLVPVAPAPPAPVIDPPPRPTRAEVVLAIPRVAPPAVARPPVYVPPPVVVTVTSVAAPPPPPPPPPPPVRERPAWRVPIWDHDWDLPDWGHHDSDDVPVEDDPVEDEQPPAE